MAVKKTARAPKRKDAAAPKKAAGVKQSAAKKETASRKTSAAATRSAAPKKSAAAPKRSAAAPKKSAAAPKKPSIKLTTAQADLLKQIDTAGETGYLSAKKGEQRSLDALRERKLIKRGTKDKASGNYHYMISNAGKKHLESAPAAPATGNSAPAPQPPAGGTA